MSDSKKFSCILLSGSVAILTTISSTSLAQGADGFYKGKSIEMIIPYGPNSGYTVYARLAVRHMGRHIPGTPNIVVKHMPGAGGLKGANYLYNVAPKDGTVMGTINQNAATYQLLGTAGIKYDAQKFTWVGRVNSNAEVFNTWHTSPIKNIKDAFSKEAIAGGTGPTSSSVVMPNVLNQLVGTKFKVISGYSGSGDVALAMERGEVHGGVRPWAILKTQSAELLKEKKLHLIVQFTLERHPDLSHVPTAVDLAKNEDDKRVLMLLASGSAVGRSIMAPPALPSDRASILRSAFQAAMKDPALLSEAQKSKLELDFMSGERLQEVVKGIFQVSPGVVAKARTVTGQK